MESIDTRLLAAKAREITERELGVYMQRTAGSQKATERARKVLPLGVPSSFQAYDPHPIVVAPRPGLVDGGRRRQPLRRLRHGLRRAVRRPLHPVVRGADRGASSTTARSSSRRARSTPTSPSCSPSATACRCGGSPTRGTEATMDAIRVARGVTGRDKIVKVEGGYHGHHDEVMISMKPPLDVAGPADRADRRSRRPPASPTAVLADTIVIPYNDADALERVLARRRRRRASSSSR